MRAAESRFGAARIAIAAIADGLQRDLLAERALKEGRDPGKARTQRHAPPRDYSPPTAEAALARNISALNVIAELQKSFGIPLASARHAAEIKYQTGAATSTLLPQSSHFQTLNDTGDAVLSEHRRQHRQGVPAA